MTTRDGFRVAPEVEAACVYNEKNGEIFGATFNLNNAVDKAALVLTQFLDEDIDWREERRMIRFGEVHKEWT